MHTTPGYPDRILPRQEHTNELKKRTLINLYNSRHKGKAQWLDDLHLELDAAVAASYGWEDYSPEMTDEEIIRRLLALNLSRSANNNN